MTIRPRLDGARRVNGGPEARGRRRRSGLILPLAIMAVVVAIAATVLYTDHAHRQLRRQQIHAQMRAKMDSTLEHVEQYFDRIHSTLLYISSDPGVSAMRTEKPAHIQSLFEHEQAAHRLAELYVIKRGFDGTRRPIMTFETGSDHLESDELHSPEREFDEYRAQIAQLRQFEEQPELRALISREIPLCLDPGDGTQASGLVYSVPVRNGGELVGIVAGMIPTRMIAAELERGNFANMAVLVSERGELYGCEDLPADTRAWFENRLRQEGVPGLFAGGSDRLRVGEWTVLRTPCKVTDGQRWWVAFLYDETSLRGWGSLQGLLMGWGSAVGILMFGLSLAFLMRTMQLRIRERETSLTQATEIQRVLLASEERYRKLFESSRDAIMTLEPPSWRFTSGNPATVRMSGATSEQDFTTRQPWALSPELQPDGRASGDKAGEMIETAMREGSHFFEWTHTRVGGEEFPATVLLTRMEVGGKTFLQATVRDITAQKRVEADLARSGEEWEKTFDAMDACVTIIDSDCRVVRANRAMREAFQGQDVIGANCYTLIHGTAQRPETCVSRRTFETGEASHAEVQEPHLGNRWFDVSAFPIRQPDGTVTQIAHVLRDITERRRMQAALRSSRERLGVLLQATPAVIYTAKASGDHGATFISENVTSQTGYTPREFVEDSAFWTNHIHPDDAPRVLAELPRLFERGYHVHEYRFRHKNGRYLWMRDEMRLVRDAQGAPVEIVAYWIDITERRREEEARRRMQAQLQEAQKKAAVGTLAGGAGHEINNPLNGIMNYAQLIKDKLGPGSPLAEYAGEIIVGTERIASVTRALRAFASEDSATRAPAHINDLLASTLAPIRDTLTRDQIAVEVDVPNGLPDITCNGEQIQRVLMTLIGNAHDALNERYSGHDANKRLIIRARSVERGTRSVEDEPSDACLDSSSVPYSAFRVRLTVEDHGPGIPEAVRERIFDPFFTTKNRSVGAGSICKGMGLFVSSALVQEHGGELRVESKPGEWTRFHVELPIADLPAVSATQSLQAV